MTQTGNPDLIFRRLSAAARRRRHEELLWTGVAIAAASLFLVVGWETLVGPASRYRFAGYAAAIGTAVAAFTRGVSLWREPGPGRSEIVERVGQLFPQTRGTLTALASEARAGLDVVRGARASQWLLARSGRVAEALAAEERQRVERGRMLGMIMLGLAIAAIASGPAAARRAVGALTDPASIWRASESWSVEPGDVEIELGDALVVRGAFAGPATEASFAIEWREGEERWTRETLSSAPSGERSWRSVDGDLTYRFRYGPFTSPAYTVTVLAPAALLRVEGRLPDEPWVPLAGRSLPAGEPIEIRGVASDRITRAHVVVDGGAPVPLGVEGARFSGTVRLGVGEARVSVEIDGSETVSGSEFTVVGAPAAFVELLAPSGDPTVLEASGAWMEIRGGSPSGLRSIGWESADGRSGRFDPVAGSRDTVVAGVTPLGAGRAPGDSFDFRAYADPVRGTRAYTPWHTAVMASRTAFGAAAAAERRSAGREVDRALEQAERVARGEIDDDRGTPSEVDAGLRAAADSLAGAIERTLADPELDPALADRLAASRRLLRGAAERPLRPRPGLPDDPRAQLAARASVLDAVRQEMAEIERLMALAGAADTLTALAAAERELAEATREAGQVDADIEDRQREIDVAAREAGEALSDSLAGEIEVAMDGVRAATGQRDPAALADAQEAASTQLSMAADAARDEVEEATGASAERLLAIDRAGAEVLFLAERQRALADRMKRPARTAGEQADRVSSQTVIVRGLEAALGALVDAIGGRPAGIELAARLAEAVFAVKYAEDAIANPPVASGMSSGHSGTAAEDAAASLALLSRAFLIPEGSASAAGGQGAEGQSGATARQMGELAEAERALADALAAAEQPEGGNPDAAARQREVGRQLETLGADLLDAGIDARALQRLAESVEATARRLERGLPGAEAETELQALARRFADLGRFAERASPERRRSETARPFIPEAPARLPERVTASRLDPETALDPWRGVLPRGDVDTARAFLEALAEAGVRSQEAAR